MMNWSKVVDQLLKGADDCTNQLRIDAADPNFDDRQKQLAKQVILTVQGVFIGLAEALRKGMETH
jgi:hypothetical protein